MLKYLFYFQCFVYLVRRIDGSIEERNGCFGEKHEKMNIHNCKHNQKLYDEGHAIKCCNFSMCNSLAVIDVTLPPTELMSRGLFIHGLVGRGIKYQSRFFPVSYSL